MHFDLPFVAFPVGGVTVQVMRHFWVTDSERVIDDLRTRLHHHGKVEGEERSF